MGADAEAAAIGAPGPGESRDTDRVADGLDSLGEQFQALSNQLEGVRTVLHQRMAELDAAASELNAREARLEEKEEALGELSAELEERQQTLAIVEQERDELADRLRAAEQAAQEQQEEFAEVRDELERVHADLEQRAAMLAEQERELAQREAAVQQLQEAFTSLSQALGTDGSGLPATPDPEGLAALTASLEQTIAARPPADAEPVEEHVEDVTAVADDEGPQAAAPADVAPEVADESVEEVREEAVSEVDASCEQPELSAVELEEPTAEVEEPLVEQVEPTGEPVVDVDDVAGEPPAESGEVGDTGGVNEDELEPEERKKLRVLRRLTGGRQSDAELLARIRDEKPLSRGGGPADKPKRRWWGG
ncbi:MAG: MCE family protein [Phycisphaerae bacterium]|jgi:chromosome segregation ATPase